MTDLLPIPSRRRRPGCRRARPAEWLELADGDVLDLRIGPVAKQLGDATVRMLAYNGSVPGPGPPRAAGLDARR